MSQLTPGKEYERKFLVRPNQLPRPLLEAAEMHCFEQGYLALAPACVRIRREDGTRYILCIKRGDDDEFETDMPADIGERLLREDAQKVASIVSKNRFVIPAGFDDLAWEVDYFSEGNEGLVVAEIEMPRKDYPLRRRSLPKWIGKEVTKDPRFKNKHLALKPFLSWPKSGQKKILKLMGV